MPISVERIRSDIETIASATSTVAGADRPTFSDNWRMARDHVAAQASAAGCHIRIDAAGNLHARPAKYQWDEPLWLSGSHVDSVPGGGDFDGIVGVIAPLEVLRAAHEAKQLIPLELVIFAEEEGTTFGLGMLGSRAWIGELNRERLSNLKNAEGQSYIDAGAMHDVQAEMLEAHRLRPREYRGFVETHVEQGPAMWKDNQPLAIVEAIAGRHQYRITIRGVANHAGSTSMRDRQDALCGAATLIMQVEGLANGLGGRTVATVGRIDCKPNAVNVIPDEVIFTIDFRSDSNDILDEGEQKLRHLIEQTCQRRGLSGTIQRTERAPVVRMDRELCASLRRAAQRVTQREVPVTVSGALHDAAILAPHVPTAMLFVASKDGVSHNPAEFSRIEDIALAAGVLHELVSGEGGAMKISVAQLNSASREDFVKVAGPFFEKSPWVAERTFDKKPFESPDHVHAKLCETMYSASDDEKMQLIQSHPDLVGKMALGGQLTTESQGEQASAGLDRLSGDEIESFKTFNTLYRERFGFPFIICARQNKKDAILAAFPVRLTHSRDEEIKAALLEITKIAHLRLMDALSEE